MERKHERRLLKKENILPLTLIVSLLGLVAVMCVDLVPVLINVVQHVNDEAELTSYMQAYGGKGIPIIVALQALQVITTVFPRSLPS